MTLDTENMGEMVVGAGGIGLLAFLGRLIFSTATVLKRVDDNTAKLEQVLTEIRNIANEVKEHKIEIALLQREVGQTKQENRDLRARIDGLADYWQRTYKEFKNAG